MFKERVAWVHFSCTKIISHLCKDLERRVKAGSVYLRNKVCHPSLPTQRVLVESTSCHTRQSLGVHKGLAIDYHCQRGVFLGLSLLWKQVGMDSTPEQAVWDSECHQSSLERKLGCSLAGWERWTERKEPQSGSIVSGVQKTQPESSEPDLGPACIKFDLTY